MRRIDAIPIEDIRAARERNRGTVLRTPLVRLELDDAPAEIWLKLENLQPIGSFKLRGAGNALALADPARLARGVVTASAGNMAQGVAWHARRRGVPCHVVVPDHAPAAKLDAVRRLGGEVIKLPFDDWWRVLVDRRYPDLPGLFIHPVSDPDVIAGNGTIGLEILEDMPDVKTILVPYGGGGLSCGIASATRELAPAVGVFGCEVDTAAPLSASLAAGEPITVDYRASFVDGIGARSVLSEMWPLAWSLLAGAFRSTLVEVADAVRLLATRNHVVAEGAGAAALAAALGGRAGAGKIVCVISGGNIEPSRLATILRGQVPD